MTNGLMHNELNRSISQYEFPKNSSLEQISSTSKPQKSVIENINFSNNSFHEETKEHQKLANLILVIENHHNERRQHPKSYTCESDKGNVSSKKISIKKIVDKRSVYC